MRGRGRRRSALGCAILALSLPLVAGCGDDGQETSSATVAPQAQASHPLPPADVGVVERAKDRVRAYCMKVAQGLGGGPGPTPEDLDDASDAIDGLTELAGRDPAGVAPDGSTAQLALSDLAENLEGTNCAPELVAQIDQALSSVPLD